MNSSRRAPTVSVVVCAYTWRDGTCWDGPWSRCAPRPPRPGDPPRGGPLPGAPGSGRGAAPACGSSPTSGPGGLSGARNTGVAAARGEVVAFLDDDAVAAPDWLEHLLRPYDDPRRRRRRGPRGRGVGGRQAGLVPPGVQLGRRVLLRRAAHRQPPWCATRSGRTCPSAAPRCWRVGGFSADVGRVGARPLGCEETELSIRRGSSRPDGRRSCWSREPSSVTTCPETAAAGATSGAGAGRKGSARPR